MRLSETYRPTALRELVGQRQASLLLNDLARSPRSTCVMLEGPPGCGKTSAAIALAMELGCIDPMYGLFHINGTDLKIEWVKDTWRHLRTRSWAHSGFKVLLIEELEQVNPQMAVFLKDGLERDRPPSTIVIATSNGSAKLPLALRQRFDYVYFHAGSSFAHACEDRISEVWGKESGGIPLPPEWQAWGWYVDDDGHKQFSLRLALDAMLPRLLELRAVPA